MGALNRILAAADTAAGRMERTVVAWGTIGVATVNVANVIARNVFGQSLAFAEELNQALVIMVTFLGVGLGARHARHIRMSALFDQLPGPARKACWTGIAVVTSALLFYLAWIAAGYAITTHRVGSVTPALRIPLSFLYALVPVGLALGGVEYALTAVRNLRRPGLHLSTRVRDGEDPDAEPHEGTSGC